MTFTSASLRRLDGEPIPDGAGRCACEPRRGAHRWTFLGEAVDSEGVVHRWGLCCAKAAAMAAKFRLPFPLTSATAPEAA